MILAYAVFGGLLVGLSRSWFGKRAFRVPDLRWPVLVLIAFLPQWVQFYLSRSGVSIPGDFAPAVLVGSQLVLLVFTWLNRKQPGFWILGLGLLLNFLVIALNGGLMPISPETVRTIYPGVSDDLWQVGQRLGNGKDVVLPVSATRLAVLSDRFTFPEGWPVRVAFSLGDVFIALGAFWMLWSLGGPNIKENE